MGGEIGKEDDGDANQMRVEEPGAELDVFVLGFEAEVAEAQVYGEGHDSAGRHRAEERCGVGNAGYEGAIHGEDGSQKVEAADQETWNPQQRT